LLIYRTSAFGETIHQLWYQIFLTVLLMEKELLVQLTENGRNPIITQKYKKEVLKLLLPENYLVLLLLPMLLLNILETGLSVVKDGLQWPYNPKENMEYQKDLFFPIQFYAKEENMKLFKDLKLMIIIKEKLTLQLKNYLKKEMPFLNSWNDDINLNCFFTSI